MKHKGTSPHKLVQYWRVVMNIILVDDDSKAWLTKNKPGLKVPNRLTDGSHPMQLK